MAGNLISCRNTNDSIYKHDGLGSSILESFSAPATFPTGLMFNGTDLFSCDYTTEKIYRHSGISDGILSSFAASSGPAGLTFDGTNLIFCGRVADRIYKHDGVGATILDSFGTPAFSPPLALRLMGLILFLVIQPLTQFLNMMDSAIQFSIVLAAQQPFLMVLPWT